MIRNILLPLLLMGCFVLVSGAQGQSTRDSVQVEKPVLRQELIEMVQQARQARRVFLEKKQSGNKVTLEEIKRVDSLEKTHAERLKPIVDEHGWPDERMVGEDGADAAFQIIRHADHDRAFQKESLDLLRDAYKEGVATGKQVAVLTDKVRVQEGKPQLYGTQKRLKDGEINFGPIKDSVNVDKRRAEMGLMPLKEHTQQLRDSLGQAIGDQEE